MQGKEEYGRTHTRRAIIIQLLYVVVAVAPCRTFLVVVQYEASELIDRHSLVVIGVDLLEYVATHRFLEVAPTVQ